MSHDSANTTMARSFERWRSRVSYQGIALAVVCALVAMLLLFGNQFAQPLIEFQQQEDRLATLRQVLPEGSYDNNPLQEAFTVQDESLGAVEIFPAKKSGQLVAVAFQMAPIGYSGPINELIAIDTQGKILGVRVLSHKETPGLGDKIEVQRSDWITRFNGLSLGNPPEARWKVKKDGGDFDQFSGATITPRAVVGGILKGLQLQQRQAAMRAASPGAMPAGTAPATAIPDAEDPAASQSAVGTEEKKS